MTDHNFTLFETAIGTCSIAWNNRGIVGLQLPEASPSKTRARMLRRFPGAREQASPAPDVDRAIAAIIALVRGEKVDLSFVAIDLDGAPPFHRRVYEVARSIPPGGTLTYGEIATRLGVPGEAREVGQAIGRNPVPVIVPCHRVVAAGGKLGGFSANGGVKAKLRLLAIESPHAAADLPLWQSAGESPAAGRT